MSVQEATPRPHHHRSTLKQRNKPFKGGSGRSKSKGRTESRKRVTSKPPPELNRLDRRNRSHLIQQSKRAALAAQRRVYAGRDGMARVIAVIPVCDTTDSLGEGLLPFPADPATGTFYSERCKHSLRFIPCSRAGQTQARWLMAVLEAIQVADTVLLLADARAEALDNVGREALAVIRAVGISSCAALLSHLTEQRQPQAVRTRWLSLLQTDLSSVNKVFCADAMRGGLEERETVEFERLLCQQSLHGISWRDIRPYLLADGISVERDESENGGRSTLRITGHMRGGRPFSPNRLVHIPLLGQTFSLSAITAAASAAPNTSSTMMDVSPPMAVRDDAKAETLESESPGDAFSPDAMMSAAEAMGGYALDAFDTNHSRQPARGEAKGKVLRVPKGTSAYQAAWLNPSDYDEDGQESSGEELMQPEDAQIGNGEEASADDVASTGMDVDEHATQLAEHRRLQYLDRHFPDEIDLDYDVSARSRLQRYRGVASLRTSTWNENEALPTEYGRIFKFANFKQSRKAACEEPIEGPLHIGQRVTLHLDEPVLTPAQLQLIQDAMAARRPLVLFGLLRHEQRQSVVHFTFTRNKSSPTTLHNKERLLAMVGFRTMLISPVLSEHNTNNLHKMLRWVGPETSGPVVGTIYAPVIFNPAPVLLFRPKGRDDATKETARAGNDEIDFGGQQDLELIGCGSVLEVNPSRIILKRVTLTGAPFKVHKRSVVVRFMFGNPQDIAWFRPVELCTRLGARGHIRESLGTHGYMKCLLDRPIHQHDTVAMHLYKRVFPKWETASHPSRL